MNVGVLFKLASKKLRYTEYRNGYATTTAKWSRKGDRSRYAARPRLSSGHRPRARGTADGRWSARVVLAMQVLRLRLVEIGHLGHVVVQQLLGLGLAGGELSIQVVVGAEDALLHIAQHRVNLGVHG